ncbi:MAG: trehalose-6-phosphate synthase [Rhodospirillales bacterium]|nr:trehalose-6-phosphate synthase [Rhodospirillales bacterium]
MPRLVIVSNRVATPANQPAAGGMAVALKAALESKQGLWFGWSGDICGDDQAMEDTRKVYDGDGGYRTVTVDLSEAQHSGYYEEFANRSLWPLLHNRLDLVSYSRADFATYRQVNSLLCECLVPELRGDDLVWVQDYHLTLIGPELRKSGVTSALGFFLHTPFPPADTFLALPCWREIIDGLLAYDVLGFQTEDDVHNFSDLVVRKLGGRQDDGCLQAGDRRCRVAAFPIGIDTAAFAGVAAAAVERGGAEQFADWINDQSVIIGVDRLDYSKGLDHRFNAFEAFLVNSPDYHGRVTFLQIAAPSREDVPEYVDKREELEALAGHINGRFTELDWVPLRYINKSLDQESLAVLYRLSRVGLVTPLKDGMNIVAKEFVAAQNRDDPAVLILSQFSGAAAELQEALIVNPYDVAGVADAIKTALEMPLDERQRRQDRLFQRLTSNTVHDWCSRFLEALDVRR